MIAQNDRINVGVIGANGMGWSDTKSFMKIPEVNIMAVCDVDENVINKRVAEVKEANIKLQTYTDYRKLLENKDIDAVIIGIVLAALILALTGYFTGTEHRPVKDVGKTALTGPATVILSGLSVGFESADYTTLVIGSAVFGAFLLYTAYGMLRFKVESPEQVGYDRVRVNLAESSYWLMHNLIAEAEAERELLPPGRVAPMLRRVESLFGGRRTPAVAVMSFGLLHLALGGESFVYHV